MPISDPIEPSLQLEFQAEKINRLLKECNDLDTLRDIAVILLELYQQKSAVAHWATERAAEAERRMMDYYKQSSKDLNL